LFIDWSGNATYEFCSATDESAFSGLTLSATLGPNITAVIDDQQICFSHEQTCGVGETGTKGAVEF